MTTATSTDTTVLEQLDFAHEQPCTLNDCDSHQPARWRGVAICGCVVLICEPCRQRYLAFVADYGHLVGWVKCDACGFKASAVMFRLVYRSLEPLP